MGFSRQEYWSGLPFPSPGDLPNPGIEPRSPALQAYSLPSKPLDLPRNFIFISSSSFFFFFFCCTGFSLLHGLFSSCSEQGYSVGAVCRLHCSGFSSFRLWALQHVCFSSCGSGDPEHRLNSCGKQAQLLHSMWDLPASGIKPMSPELAAEFFTTDPPGKPRGTVFFQPISYCSTVDLE